MSNFYNPLHLDPKDLFTAQALTVSGGATPSATSSRLPVYKDSKLQFYVSNTGASTNVTVIIYATPTLTSLRKGEIQTFTLGVNDDGWTYLDTPAVPGYVYAIATNNDSSNSAIITATVDRYR